MAFYGGFGGRVMCPILILQVVWIENNPAFLRGNTGLFEADRAGFEPAVPV